MSLDRGNPEFRPIAFLIQEPHAHLLGELDRLTDAANTDDEFLADVANSPLSHGEQALLRIALWFWNGAGSLSQRDVTCLDSRNRERFVRAMAYFLGVRL